VIADPLAYLVGPVEVQYDGDPTKSRVDDLSRFIDPAAKTVKSETGEEWLDYGKGIFRLNTPKAQAVAGFLKAAGSEFHLKDVTVQSDNDYAVVTVVPLDDEPIATSHKLLIQIGTVARPTGWQQQPGTGTAEDNKTQLQGFKVVATGKMPWQVTSSEITLTVKNSFLTKATALDPGGYPTGEVTLNRSAGSASLRLPGSAIYIILH
jgi:hypothetical protein